MNAAVQAVNDFPWGLVLLVVLIGGLIYVWRSGMLGKETEDKIKAKRADLYAKAHELLDKAKTEEKKLAAIQAPIPDVAAASAPTATRDEDALLAHAKAIFDAGKITQAQYDAAVAKIVAND